MTVYSPQRYSWKRMRRERERAEAIRALVFVGGPLVVLIGFLGTR